MKPAIPFALVTAFALVASALSMQAFAADSFEDRMDACASLSDNFARLACFDREMHARSAAREPTLQSREAAQRAAGIGTPSAAMPPATPPPAAVSSRPMTPAPMPAKPPEPEAFTAKVVAVTRPSGREMRIELDNGEVWRENDRSTEMQLDAGDEVRIRPAALGSFMLRAPSGRSTRVHREK
jgi:hypothetical protein